MFHKVFKKSNPTTSNAILKRGVTRKPCEILTPNHLAEQTPSLLRIDIDVTKPNSQVLNILWNIGCMDHENNNGKGVPLIVQ